MKNNEINKILKFFITTFMAITAFSAINAEAFLNCDKKLPGTLCEQSERQKVQMRNLEISNNLTNFKLTKIRNDKLPTISDTITPSSDSLLVTYSSKRLKNNKTMRPKFINRNYEYAILALDQKGLNDLTQCVKDVEKGKYKNITISKTIKLQTAINLMDSFLINDFEKNQTRSSSTEPSGLKCSKLFNLIFGATFKS